MKTHELLDRLELLYPNNEMLQDLRRAFVDDDRNSLQRLIGNINPTEITNAVRMLEGNKDFVEDSLSQGQIKSKLWLINELKKLKLDLGTVFLCAGWYAILATLIFENNIKVTKIRSFDIDKTVLAIAERFNKKWVLEDWKFKPAVYDIHDINFNEFTYNVTRTDGQVRELTDKPDTIINTSCEHINNFSDWYRKIPAGKLLILQTNNYFDLQEHVNCSDSLASFGDITPMEQVLYEGSLDCGQYVRFMRIGIR
jgi:hypothetical protein